MTDVIPEGRHAQLVMPQHKCTDEIERAVDKVKLGVVTGRKRTKADKWFRKQWYRAMMRDRKRMRKKPPKQRHGEGPM